MIYSTKKNKTTSITAKYLKKKEEEIQETKKQIKSEETKFQTRDEHKKSRYEGIEQSHV
jgi:hypothetical protein